MSSRADASAAAGQRAAKSRAALIAAYREGLGLAAIAAFSDGEGTRIAAISEAHGTASPGPSHTVTIQWWCRRAADAERVTAAATARLRRRESQDGLARFSPTTSAPAVNDLSAVIQSTAKRLRVVLCSDDEICAEAERIIARVDEEIENLKRAGEMKSVNQSYRAYRLEANARGEKAALYVDWFNKYRVKLVRELATALRYT